MSPLQELPGSSHLPEELLGVAALSLGSSAAKGALHNCVIHFQVLKAQPPYKAKGTLTGGNLTWFKSWSWTIMAWHSITLFSLTLLEIENTGRIWYGNESNAVSNTFLCKCSIYRKRWRIFVSKTALDSLACLGSFGFLLIHRKVTTGPRWTCLFPSNGELQHSRECLMSSTKENNLLYGFCVSLVTYKTNGRSINNRAHPYSVSFLSNHLVKQTTRIT